MAILPQIFLPDGCDGPYLVCIVLYWTCVTYIQFPGTYRKYFKILNGSMKSLMIQCVRKKLSIVMANAVIWEWPVLYSFTFGAVAKHVFHRCSFLYYKSANNCSNWGDALAITSSLASGSAVSSVRSPFWTGLILGHLASLVILSPFERSVYNFKYTNFEKRCF